jgi:hypothetical protein
VFGYLKSFKRVKLSWTPVIVTMVCKISLAFTGDFKVSITNQCDHFISKITNYNNWKEFYPDAIEELPHNMPTLFGKKV